MRSQSEPVRLAGSADPVATFLRAHETGTPVTLPTSGSTGRPRTVVRSTASWVRSFPHVEELTGLSPSSRVWVPGPLSSTMSLFAVVHARYVGAQLVPTAGEATHAVLTPAALDRSLEELTGVVVMVAGDGLSPALHEQATAAGAHVCHYYGAAELSFVAWGPHREALAPFPGVEVEVRDSEIWARSAYACEGYDAGTGPLRVCPDGFATVGDRGRLENGFLTVLGRPDAVTTAGVTVRVTDVEAVLRPGARGEVIVVGAPHDRLGAVLSVVLTDASDLDPVRARAREVLAGAERPRSWFHRPHLPLTEAGKVDRVRLAALAGAAGGMRRLVTEWSS
ncbi:MAG TPA: AMP-binding protein [Nocardioidaceae bacterium]|nr:AMP-binding protein [Nocardioidaceae bacterium]